MISRLGRLPLTLPTTCILVGCAMLLLAPAVSEEGPAWNSQACAVPGEEIESTEEGSGRKKRTAPSMSASKVNRKPRRDANRQLTFSPPSAAAPLPAALGLTPPSSEPPTNHFAGAVIPLRC